MSPVVERLKAEIDRLSPLERAELESALRGEDDEWDKQMKRDAANGKLDGLIAEARSQIAARKFREMP